MNTSNHGQRLVRLNESQNKTRSQGLGKGILGMRGMEGDKRGMGESNKSKHTSHTCMKCQTINKHYEMGCWEEGQSE